MKDFSVVGIVKSYMSSVGVGKFLTEIKTTENGYVDYLKLNDEMIGYGIEKMIITLEAGEIKIEALTDKLFTKHIDKKLFNDNNIELYIRDREEN